MTRSPYVDNLPFRPIIIDSFSSGGAPLSFSSSSIPYGYTGSVAQYYSSSSILGGERDVILTATSSPQESCYAAVSNGSMILYAPEQGAYLAYATIQYDGADGSTHLNSSGLLGMNFTSSGAEGIYLDVNKPFGDSLTEIQVTFMSNNGYLCKKLFLKANDSSSATSLLFANFDGCSYEIEQIGAVEIQINLVEPVRLYLNSIGTYRHFFPSQSPSYSPSPSVRPSYQPYYPSASATSNVASKTPGLSPPPSVQKYKEIFPVDALEVSSGTVVLNGAPDKGYSYGQGYTIIGGERDVVLETSTNSLNQSVSTGYYNNLLFGSVPLGASATFTFQYDGPDNSSSLDTYGLNGIDLTEGGANAFNLFLQAKGIGSVYFYIYPYGSTLACVSTPITIDGAIIANAIVKFSDFNSCNSFTFESVGAVELILKLKEQSAFEISLLNLEYAYDPPQ